MKIRVKVHSHDTGLPEHDQVQFHTEHPGGLMVLRLPKGATLPPIGAEFVADFTPPDDASEPAPQAGEPADRTADTLGEDPPAPERFDDEHGPAAEPVTQ